MNKYKLSAFPIFISMFFGYSFVTIIGLWHLGFVEKAIRMSAWLTLIFIISFYPLSRLFAKWCITSLDGHMISTCNSFGIRKIIDLSRVISVRTLNYGFGKYLIIKTDDNNIGHLPLYHSKQSELESEILAIIDTENPLRKYLEDKSMNEPKNK